MRRRCGDCGGACDRKSVVLGEIARLGATGAEGLFEAPRRLFVDVLVERPRRRTRLEDALDGGVFERAEACRVGERGVDVGGAESSAKQKDGSRLMPPDPGRSSAEEAKEGGGTVAHALERDGEVLEINRALATRSGV